MHFQWLIQNCSLSSFLNVFSINRTLIITTGHELYIPSHTLPFALFYQVQRHDEHFIEFANQSICVRQNDSIVTDAESSSLGHINDQQWI
jgi:hypothetical protein